MAIDTDPTLHRRRRLWSAAWPKLAAVALALAAWQVLVWMHWRPEYVLPAPPTVARELANLGRDGAFWKAVAITGRRALTGYAIAVVLGALVGLAVARVRPLRVAIGSL